MRYRLRAAHSKVHFAGWQSVILICLYFFVISCSKGTSSVDDFVGEGDGSNDDPVRTLSFDPPAYDFGPLLTTASSPLSKSITVKNDSGGTLFITTISGGTSTHFTMVSETCLAMATSGLNNGDSCSFVVEFKPTAAGLHNFAVSFGYGDAVGSTAKAASVNFLGTGAAPANLLISDGPTFDYGPIVATAISEKSFTVTNVGNVPATSVTGGGLAAPFEYKGGVYPGTGGTCATTLAAGASCSVVVTFNPLATGLATDAIEITFDSQAAIETSTRAIQGTGATPASVTISDAPGYDYGTFAVGATSDKVFTLSNSGGVSATSLSGSGLSAPFTFKGGTFPGTGGNCGATLASAGSCTVVVSYAPTATGTVVDSVDLSYFDGLNAQTLGRAVQGTAVTPAVLTIDNGPTYDFGTLIVSASADVTFTVSNVGGYNASFITGSGLAAPFAFKGGTFPGTGGTCAASLGTGSTCTVVLTYAPTAAGSFSGTLTVGYVNGASSQSTTRAMQGLAVTPAALAISDGPTFSFGTRPSGSTADKTFTVSNSGGTNATSVTGGGLVAPFTYKGGAYPGTGGTCGATINSGDSCSVVVTYAPVSIAAHSGTVDLNYDNGLTTVSATRAVTGNGVAPAQLSLSDGPTYDYGFQPIGKSVDKTFTLSNGGGFGASSIAGSGLSAPFSFKGGSFPGTGGTCAATLAAGATCTVVVNYTVAAAVVSNNTITISYDDGVNSQSGTRDVQGTGVTAALLTISDGPAYDFGPVATGDSAEYALTVSNTGAFTASVISGSGLSAPFTFKGGTFPGTGGTCSTSLAGGGSCTVVVRFAPTSTGALSSTVSLSYDNGVSTQTASRTVQGLGTLPATLVISDGPTYSFGLLPYGATTTKSFNITNVGGVTASAMSNGALAAPFTFLGGTYPGTGGTCTATLAATATCTVVLEYAPVAAGVDTATLNINYFDKVNSQTASRPLTGTGVNPALLAIDQGPTYNFGTVAVGGQSDVTLNVTNTGAYAASVMSGSGLSAPFTFKGGAYPGTGGTCAGSLNAGATCTVVVNYAPSGTGIQTVTANVLYNNGVSAQTSSRPLQGTGAAPASLAVSDGPTYDYGNVASGGSSDKTFTITNSGGVTATGLNGSGLTTPFAFKGGGFPGTGGTCAATLAASATCTVVISFSPIANGAATNTVTVGYFNGAAADSATRDLQGTGVTPATLGLSDGPTYDYGSIPVTGSAEKILTVTNSGAFAASAMTGGGLSPPFTYKGGSFPGTGGTCAASLAPAANCTVAVIFSPSATGSFSSTVSIAYFNGAASANATVGVQGVGATPGQLTISDGPTYNFGSWPNGDLREKTFSVTNGGGVPATAITGSGLAAPFTFKGGTYPGTGGTCGVSLNPSASCTIILQYSPSSLGVSSDTIELNYNDGLVAQVSTRDVLATSVPPADLSISDGATYDFGTVAVGGSTQKTFTVTNVGGFAASAVSGTGLSSPFAFKGGSYPGTGGTCATSLNVSASCTIVVTYSPVGTGVQSGTITMSFNNGVSVQSSTRAVQGTGAAPALLSLSDGPTYSFPSVPTGSSADKTLTLTNSGGVAASAVSGAGLSAPFAFKGGSYPGTGGSCGVSLAASANCTLVVTFAPTIVGTPASQVDISYNDGVGAQSTSRAVDGVAVGPASITISDGPTFDYGTQANGSSIDKTFTLTNSGGYPASAMAGSGLSAPFLFKGGSYPGSGGTCGASLTNGNSCTVVVTFAPTSSGVHNGTMSVSYNNGASVTSATRGVQGTGAAPANITISDGPLYNYGTKATGSSTDKTLTITNSGGVPATALVGTGPTAPFAFKGGSYPGAGGTCAGTLAAAGTCTVVVTYAPASTGAHSSAVDMTYNDGVSGQTSSRTLQGTGAAPASLAASDGPTYDYGPLATGGTLDKTFTVTNSGGVAATSVSGGGLASPFSFKGGTFPGTGGTCAATLNASATCTVVVNFSPTTGGVHTSSVSVTYNDGVTGQAATRALTGTGVTPANITISDGLTYNFGVIPSTSSVDKSFTLTNTGDVTATTMSGAGLSAPYTYKGGTYPGVGGTCAASLASTLTCTVVVTFNPTANGASSSQIDISYFDGAVNQTSSRAVQGTGAPPASLLISDGPTYNYGNVANGSINDHTFVVTNGGGVASSSMTGAALSSPYTYKGGSYPGTGGTCAAALGATLTCTVVVTYQPSVLGASSGTLTVNYNDGLAAQASNRAISGTAVNPANLLLSDGPSFDFGTWATGGATERTFTITNNGDVTATTIAGSGLAAPFAFKGGAYPGTGGTCSTTLNASATCSIVVRYAPTATGTQSDAIEIDYFDGAGPQTSTRAIQGTGATPANLSISDGLTYDYGTLAVGGLGEKTFTVSNSGGVGANSMSGSGLSAPFSFKGGGYPGTGGTCAATLASSATCTIVVRYNPSSIGTQNGTINLSYNDGVNAQSVTRDVTGTAVAPASLSISDGATYNFGTLANGASADKSLTVTNGGSFAASSMTGSGLGAPFSFKGGSYPGTGGTCGSSLNPAATCTIIVTFAPTVSGLHTGTATVNYHDGASAQTSSRAMQGTGAAPASLTVSDGPTFDFGTRATGSSSDKTFTVSNSGGVDATSVNGSGLSAPFTFKGGSFPGTGGNCAATLAGGANCTIVVNYAPVATGSQSSTLNIGYNDGVTGQTATRAIQGTGAAPASLALSDSPFYDYGSIANGGSAEKSFTLTNSGGVTATAISGGGLASPFSFKGGTFPGTGGTCAASLAASGTCTMIVVFAPTSVGAQTDDIDVAYDNGVSVQSATRTLNGTGVAPALLALSDGPSFDFGPVVATGSSDKSFTVSNSGSLPATSITGSGLSAPFSFKGGSYPGTGGTCAGTLNAAATCTVIVTFDPSVTGSFSGSITLGYNDGAQNQTSARAVQGTGATPASISISDGPTYDFGNLANGALLDKTFTLSNGGGVSATTMNGAGLSAPFYYKGGTYPGTGGTCATTLAAASTCTVVVTYNPTTIAIHNSTINISYNNGLTGTNSTRAVTGTGVPPASLLISDGATYDFGIVATGGSAEKIFTVSNTGSYSASVMAGAGLAAPFAFKGGSYPGTGGNCSTTLNPSATCTMVVTYAPSSTGTQSGTLSVNYYDGANNQTSNRAIQGTGAAPATLTISDGPGYDFGTVANGSSNDKSFTLTNSGGVSATGVSGGGLAAPFTFKGGTFPGTGGTCSSSLSASGTCVIVVNYSPSTIATHNGTMTVSYNDGVTGQSALRSVQGTAVAPASISISDGPTYNFGSVANGSSNDKTFTLTNTGTFGASAMTGNGLSAPYSFKGGSYPGSGGTCSTTLASSATCTIVVNFAPVASATHNGTINIDFNNGAVVSNSTRAVTGVSAPPAVLAISDGPTYDFGTKATGSSTDKSFTVTNTGGVPATSVAGSGLSAPFTFKGGTYPGSGGTCSTTIASTATCTVVVTYAPSSTGPQSTSLSMDFVDGVTNQSSARPIQGTGAAPATLAISDGPTYNFGDVANGGSSDKTLTVTNSGGVPATSLSGSGLSAPFTFKGGTFPGTGGSCTTNLNASGTCTVVVSFAPTSAGIQNATVTVSFDNGVSTGLSTTRDLAGTGVTPAILAFSDGPTFDFGAVVATGSSDKTFTLNNSGSLQATGMSGSGLSAPYTFKGGSYPGTGGTCGSSLNSATSCTVVVTFNPSVTGSFNATMSVAYHDGAQAQSATRAIQGTGAAPASITISDGATYSFGTVANGSTNDKSFTLTNGGGVSSSAMTGSGLSAPFTFKGGAYPGTGGTCGAVLAAAGTCTVVVNYNPATIAVHNGQFDITYNNGLSGQTSSRPVTGTAVAPASLTLSDGPTYDYGIVATGGVAEKIFTISNGGSFAASVMSGGGLTAPFSFKGGSYPGTGGNCGTSLNGGSSCSVVVVYSPSSTGVQSDDVDLSYFDGAQNQTASRAVQGTGAAPALLTISDGATYSFGTVASGSSTDKSFTITNTGGVTATSVSGGGLSAPYAFKGGTFPGTGGTCSATMTAGATCSVVVTYNPSNIATHNGQIDISYVDGVSAQSVSRPVTGIAVAPALITISDGTTYNFGTRANGSSTDKVFTLTNTGSFAASTVGGAGLSAPYLFKGGSYPGTGGTCASTMAAAATCTVVVTFNPTSSGTHNGQMDITYNNGVSGQTSSRGVTGQGAPPATLLISDGATFNFGTKATGSLTDKTFTVQNTGGVDATSISTSGLAAPITFKGGSYPGTGGTCGTSIAASATCTVVVTYAPVSTGAHGASLDFTFDDGVTASQTSSRPIQATGAAPATITISDATTYNFGSIANGGSADKAFTLTNSGGVGATAMAGSGLAAPFAFKGGSYPGTGGTCGGTLAATATCTVVVTFAPTSAGLQSDTMNIAYNDGVNGQTSTRDMEGTGVAPALLAISDGPSYDFGAVVATASADKTFTVDNSGSLAATSIAGSGLSAPFTFKGGGYPGTGGTCGGTLNASASCTIVVTFNPSVTGSFNQTVSLSYNDGAQAQSATRDLQGTGATPASISISDGATYNFGTVANGSSQDKTFTLTNGGGVAATSLAGSGLSAPFTFKGGSYPGTGGSCSGTLNAGQNCTVVVNYNPSTIATHNATMSIGYHDGLNSQSSTRAITGTAVAPASLTLSDGPTYDYGTLATGASLDKTFTVTNGGGFAASSISGSGLSAPFTFKGGGFPGTGGSCTSTLNAGANCTIVITWSPTATGLQSATINVAYNNGASAQNVTGDVQGTGAAPATLTISDGATYNYGSFATGTNNDKSFTITNSGGVAASSMSGSGLSAPFSFKGGTYPGTGGSCGTALAASGTCTVVVTYSPTVAGTQSSQIDISYNDGVTGQSTSRPVQGTGLLPANITISDGATYNYGTRANGSSTDKSFTLTNAGSFTATAMTGSGLSAPYSFKGGSYPGTGGNCSTTLAAAGTCTVVVTFNPSSNGTYNGQFDIGYHNGVSAQTSSRPVTGIGAPPATFTISDGATYNYGTKATGSSTDKTFTVGNTGGVDATSVSVAALSAPFSFKGGSFPGTGGDCGATLAAAASCTIVVTYAPTGTGPQSDTISVTFNDGVTASQSSTRGLQGTGAAPAAISISDGATYNFGTIANGGSADKTLTLTNTGGVSATAVSGGGLSAPYGFKGGSYPGAGGTCASSLAATGTCTVVVTFAPVSSGVHNGSIDISFNNGVSAGQTSSRAVTGTGVAPAVLDISDSPLYDFGAVVATGSADKTLTVTNSGQLAASSILGSGFSAPFSFKGGSYPGTGGTCGATLTGSASCTIVVTFNPAVTGSYSNTMNLAYFDGAANQNSTRDVQGVGATAASISISDGATYNFGTVANGSTQDKTLTLTNGGGVAATAMSGSGLSAPYTFKGGSYPGTGGTCAATLNAAATCTIVVNYNPSTIATHNATISISYTDGLTGQSATRAITGAAVAPASLALSDGATYDFGTVATGASSDKTFTVTNTGTFTASGMNGSNLSAPFSFKGGSYPGTGGSCSATLNGSGSTCTIVVTYAPSSTGTQSGTIHVTYNDGASGQTAPRAVQGTGAAPALLTISDAGFTYGTVANGSSHDKTFTVTNSGGVPATGISGGGLAVPFSFKGGSYPGTGGTCSTTLAAGGTTCTVVVTFNSASSGTYNDTIEIDYNDGVSAQQATRAIQGISAAPALLTISDATTYDFGNVANGGTAEKTFTVTNSGGFTALSLSGTGLAAPFTFKGGTYPGAGGNCGATLIGAGTCTVVVSYSPVSIGSHTGTLQIDYNDGTNNQNATRPLQGVGAAPASLSVSDGATYSFGTVAQGSSNEKVFTLTNNGGAAASTVSGTGLSAPFAFKGGTFPGTGGTCTANLNPSTSCTFVVTYSPGSVATSNGTITVNYNDGVNPQSTTRDVTGTSVSAALLTISNSPSYDFGTIANGASLEFTFTITNTGTFAASSVAGAGLTAPFSFKGGTYPGTGGTCSTSLNGSSTTCTVVVTFAPGTTGSHSAPLQMNYNNGASNQQSSITVQGTSAGPAVLTVSDGPTYSYGTVATTTSKDKTFTVTNSGGVQATSISGGGVSAPFTFKGGTFPGTGGSCTSTLSASANCTIVVNYAPTAAVTTNQTISVGYNDGVAAQSATRPITGTGAAPALLAMTDYPTYDYGTIPVGATAERTFTVSNSGGLAATSLVINGLATPYEFKGGTYPGTGGNCSTSIAVSGSCTIVVTFAPGSSGTLSDAIDVSYNDGAATQSFSTTVQGTGSTAALLTISNGPTYSFGTVANGSSNDKSFTVTNSGGVSATSMAGASLSAPYSFKGGSYPGTGGNCSATLAAAASCSIVVTYAPATNAVHNATVQVDYHDGLISTNATRAMTGTAVAPALLSISDGPTYDYGTLFTGFSADYTFTVSNSGGFTATALAGAGLTPPFTFKGGAYPGTGGSCGATLALTSCTIVVTYAPTVMGTDTQTISVNYNNGASNTSATRAVVGAAVPPDPPSAPGTPTYAITAFNQLNLTWTGSVTGTAPITYGVYRSTTSGSGFALIQGGITTPFNYNDSSVTAGTTYYYKIRATGPGGDTDSGESNAVPLGTFALSSATPGDRSVQLAWTASTGATTYTVRYGTATGVWGSIASTTATSPYTVTGLTAGTTYYFMVQAVNANGSMNASGGELSAVPKAVPVILSKGNAADSLCSIMSNGDLKCWGRAVYGILGNGSEANFGDDTDEVGDSSQAAMLGTGHTAASIYTGPTAQHWCAILNDGSVKCWGRNNAGQLGYGDTVNRGTDPSNSGDNLGYVQLGSGRTAVKLALGSNFTCALLDNGTVKCWGSNANGQLGQDAATNLARGDGPNEMGDNLNTVILSSTATDISAGSNHACAILSSDSSVRCWGRQDNNIGQLGNNSINNTNLGDVGGEMATVAAVPLGAGRTAVAIGSGLQFNCALLDDASVKCWGLNSLGQLGQDDTTNRGSSTVNLSAAMASINLGAGRTATQIAVGYRHACALLDNSTLKCWGSGTAGALGQGSTSNWGSNNAALSMGSLAAISLTSVGGVLPTAVTAGLDITCAKLNNSTTKCWGQNATGQLALGDNVAPNDSIGNVGGEMGGPLQALNLGTATTVTSTVAGRDVICSIRNDGKLFCFGDNNYGRILLGQPAHTGDDPDEMGSYLTKVNLGTGLTATKVSVGLQHACAIVNTGQVKCWGRNQYGQLGYEDTTSRNTPAQMGDALPFVDLGAGVTAVEIASGSNHICVITNTNTVKCWGRNNGGALGYGNTTNRGHTGSTMGTSLGNVDIGTSKTAKAIAAGQDISCAILNDDTIKCWGVATGGPLGKGSNTAHLGDAGGEMGDLLTAINVGAGRTVSRMSVGIQHVCVILDDNTVHCWGNGGNGRLGYDGTGNLGNAGGQMPTAAVNLGVGRTAKRIAAGAAHTCAILDDDSIKCWGNGGNGRLGQGSTSNWGSNGTTLAMANLNAVNLPTGLTAKEIVAINGTTCAILSDDQVRCFGSGVYGTIGNENVLDIGDAGTEMGDNLPVAPLW